MMHIGWQFPASIIRPLGIATLRDDPLAIVRNALGQGQVLAIGPHIEVMSHQLRNEALLHGHDHDGGRYHHALAHKLAADDDPRLRCFHHLLQKAFI